jgi:hypothetical protein
MTFNPDTLLAARSFLLEHLDLHEGKTVGADLEPDEVGIKGDGPHARSGSSYHLGADQLRPDSYTITESSRDRRGLSDAASALDIGEFEVKVGGKNHNLRTFSAWLVAQCKAGAADTADIREVNYCLDGVTVHRWDRLGRRSTGDSSHRWHTHISYFRDSEKRDKAGLFRRYLTEIGLLEDDMLTAKDIVDELLNREIVMADGTKRTVRALFAWEDAREAATRKVVLDALAGKDSQDQQVVVAGVLAGLQPEVISAAIPAELAEQVAQKLADRLAS